MESESAPDVAREGPSTLQKIRNMWEFASLMQYIFFFGKAVRIEDIEVEVSFPVAFGMNLGEREMSMMVDEIVLLMCGQDFEQECLKPEHSERLSRIGLALLKFVSSHKGLT